MSRRLLLLLALSLPTGAALGQEAGQPEIPPSTETAPAAGEEQPKPPEVPPARKAPPPAPSPSEESKPEMETLVSSDISSGGYGGPAVMYSRILDRDTVFLGGKGGWIVNHSFVLGLAGFALTTRVPTPRGAPDIGEDLRTEFGYGGLWLEYVFLPNKLVHASIGTLLGGGSVAYIRIRHTEIQDRVVENDIVLAAEPAVSLELNISRSIRVSVGAGYRYVGGINLTGLRTGDLNGFTASAILKFGRF